MLVLDGVNAHDEYSSDVTIAQVWGSPGGYYVVAGAPVYMQLQYTTREGGAQGSPVWTSPEVPVGVSQGVLFPGTIGVRFRNKAPGVIATVTAALAEPGEPTFAIGAATA